MRIINKQEFLVLPEGILYSEYEPCAFYGLKVKGETWESDYLEIDLIGNIAANDSVDYIDRLDYALENRTSLELDFDSDSRNGLFEDNTLYAVYEQKDLNELISSLKTCKGYEQ